MINATTVQNDVIVRRFINSMNMAMDAQYDYVIMQLMVGNMIIVSASSATPSWFWSIDDKLG